MSPALVSTTQNFISAQSITQDLIFFKNGSASLVLQVSSLNFGLLSEEEQEATIFAYASLLNSLSFPIQILISSRKKDVTDYLKYLDDQIQKLPQRTKQIQQYSQFVKQVVKNQKILQKSFYIIIPFSYLEMGGASSLLGSKNIALDEKRIKKTITALSPKRDHLIRQFSRLGLMPRQLGNQELLQLVFRSLNPGAPPAQLESIVNLTQPIQQISPKQ